MLIIYRTSNGEIISLDFETPAAAMDAYLAQSEHGDEMAYLEMTLGTEVLAALVASVRGHGDRNRFCVDVSESPTLLDGDMPVVSGSRAKLLAAEIEAATDLAGLKAATAKVLGLAKPEATDVLEWIVAETVIIGTRRMYEGVEYRCIQAHTTQSDYTPDSTPALWNEVVVAGDSWQSGTTYELGATVTHDGATWESRRANNVWEPGANDSGWLRTEPYPSAWYYLGGEGYPVDWEVTHGGQQWTNTVDGNHWEPDVYGWVVVA